MVPSRGFGHDDGHPPKKVADAEKYAPSILPDRIVLTWTGDPATSIAVSWRTSADVRQGYVEYAEATPGPQFVRASQRVSAQATPLDAHLGKAHYHSTQLSDLKPETKYAYRVGDGTNWSEWNQFTTASSEAKPFTFVYFGDAQNDIHSHWSRVVREAYRDAPKAAFLLHAGDLVNKGDGDADWGEWFAAGSHIHRMIPCIATPGNHEYIKTDLKVVGVDIGRKLTPFWHPVFSYPENGPEILRETAYFIDYQGVRIVSLNSNEHLDEQAHWLDQVLTDCPCRWKVVTFHHPIYSSAAGRDNAFLRKAWQPVFDKHHVDLVLQGHDHTYSRSHPLKYETNVATGVTARSENGGTVYVVSVSGPKMYNLEKRPLMARGAEDTQLYQIVHVNGDTLRYEARTATGQLYDGFQLNKSTDGTNRITEQIPDTPERLRDE
ncbi:MAG: metallophosphoesterase family protein [Planctomycetaceae bacterium]|nr:metallophosphoesterase family protein [Planctomycetaceae bacterium]